LQASRNHTLINIIDAVLAANPHLKRDAEELAALDARDTVSSSEAKRPRLGGRRESEEEQEEESEEEDDEDENEEEEAEEDDDEEDDEEEDVFAEPIDVAFALGAPPEAQGTPGYIVWVSLTFQ